MRHWRRHRDLDLGIVAGRREAAAAGPRVNARASEKINRLVEWVRAILDGLEAAYGRTIDQAATLTGRAAGAVHVVGGGARNRLVCHLTRGVADALWVGGSVAAVVFSLRAFGMAWRWALLALIWTPIEQGLFTGNVVIPSLLVMGAAMRYGGALVLGPLLKPQNGIVSLWLIRERAWRRLGGGLLALLLLVLATVPLTGIDLWREWLNGLTAYQESQGYLHGLYGVGLGRYLPMWAFLAIAAFTVLAALWVRGREGLARLGLASVVASPSLWSHGFVFGIPSFLRLRAEWLWLVAGMMSIGQWPGPQVALGIGVTAWFVKGMARHADEEAVEAIGRRPLHPLGSFAEPWPSDEDRRPAETSTFT